MPQIRNVDPYGALDVPLVHREGEPYGVQGVGCVEAGEVLDLDADTAARLLVNGRSWEPVDDAAVEVRDALLELAIASGDLVVDDAPAEPAETSTPVETPTPNDAPVVDGSTPEE